MNITLEELLTKTPEEMTMKELVLTLKGLGEIRTTNEITYERELELGLPILKEYEKRYNEKVREIAIRGGRRVPGSKRFRWDERHQIRLPLGD